MIQIVDLRPRVQYSHRTRGCFVSGRMLVDCAMMDNVFTADLVNDVYVMFVPVS